MDGEVLITLVQNYEELYNLKHSQYSNQQRRDNIWEEIGNIMKLPSEYITFISKHIESTSFIFTLNDLFSDADFIQLPR